MAVARNQLNELLYQALETEMGGVKVYEAAVQCAINGDLNKEWNEYMEQTREHVRCCATCSKSLGSIRKRNHLGGRSSVISANRW